MPYICLARGDVPDSTLQVLDLLPNSSQSIPSLTPPGESRYVNRVKTGTATINAAGTLDGTKLDGLGAYLIDNVEPGGLEQAAGSITILVGLAAPDTIVLNGVTFTATVGAADAANQIFRDVATSGLIATTITELVAAIVHPTPSP